MILDHSKEYIASEELQLAVKASIILEKPLLVKGEPGTGKTVLAEEIAKSLNCPLVCWHIKSTTSAQQGLYQYDAVSRLRDSQLGNNKVDNIAHYIKPGKLWEAFDSENRVVLLIDEIDKADIEFPNDLLQELDRMEFYCYELQKTIKAKKRPVVIITSNNEKELPDAFLRRCLFHFISFPTPEMMQKILGVHFPNLKQKLMQNALEQFYKLRDLQGIKKKPSTSELIDWMRLLVAEDFSGDKQTLKKHHFSALIKNEQDLDLIQQLLA